METEKTNKCSVCGKAFALKSHLRVHEMMHKRNDKAHKCVECGKQFVFLSSLKTHLLKHAPQLPYDCHICEQVFTEKCDFQKHLESHVNGDSSANFDSNDSIAENPSEVTHVTSKIQSFSINRHLKCLSCRDVFFTQDALNQHTEKKIHHCEKCDKFYATCHSLKVHLSNHIKKVECKVCSVGFPSLKSLKRHEYIHMEKQLCSYCGKRYSNERALREHLYKMHQKSEKVKCKFCGEKFSRSDLLNHKMTHQENTESYQCETCKQSFSELYKLKNHEKLHEKSNGSNYWNCEVCEKTLSSKQALETHSLKHSGERECSLCSVILPDAACLQHHMLKHSIKFGNNNELGNSPQKAQCHICGNMYDRNYLMTHVSIHRGEKCFTCNECGKSFVSRANLRGHMLVHSERKYQCELCDSKFATRKSLVIHARRHTGEKPYACKYCLKGFVTSWTLQNHLRLHEDEKAFTCVICAKKFGQKKSLYAHYAGSSHTKEELKRLDPSIRDSISKKYVCSVCGKNCNEKTVLAFHMRTHTGEKPFECSVCGKCFRYKSAWKIHMRIHTGEYRSECTICKKKFIHRWQGEKHALIHHGEKSHLCTVCGKSFYLKGNLKLHMDRHAKRRLHSCNLCKQEFTSKEKCNSHQKICSYGVKITTLVIKSKNIDSRVEAEHSTPNDGLHLEKYEQKDHDSNTHSFMCSVEIPLDDNTSSTQVIISLSEDSDSIREDYVISETYQNAF